ncbi:MAG: BMP family ABC transporter substrate-binding protein, partial [Oscillospiraceae bacterium]
MRKLFALTLALAMVLAVAGCGGASSAAPAPSAAAPAASAAAPSVEPAPAAPAKVFSAGMVTDIGGVNDQSFNQSAWEGLQKAEKDFGIKVGYIESKQEADYGPNLDRMVDEDYDLIWGVGYAL